MTEKNIFCFSKTYNDDDSFQQERFRAFNKLVTEERYEKIRGMVREILKNTSEQKDLKIFWESVTSEQWKELLKIPEAKDFKDGFEYISGQEININSCEDKLVEIEGKTYKLVEQL